MVVMFVVVDAAKNDEETAPISASRPCIENNREGVVRRRVERVCQYFITVMTVNGCYFRIIVHLFGTEMLSITFFGAGPTNRVQQIVFNK